ncbi:MAG: JAB domain-containing protein [Verrucomicrobiota bacterium]
MKSYMVKVLRIGEAEPSMRVDTPQVARRYWDAVIKRQTWFDEQKETLVTLLLSTRCTLEGYSLVAIGSLNESIAHPREIFRAAVAGGFYGIVLMHNHPSGDPSPSQTDLSMTRQVSEAANILQIPLFDHIIVGRRQLKSLSLRTRKDRSAQATRRRGYFSFKEAGKL